MKTLRVWINWHPLDPKKEAYASRHEPDAERVVLLKDQGYLVGYADVELTTIDDAIDLGSVPVDQL